MRLKVMLKLSDYDEFDNFYKKFNVSWMSNSNL